MRCLFILSFCVFIFSSSPSRAAWGGAVVSTAGDITAVSNQVVQLQADLTATSNQVIQLQADLLVTSNQVIDLDAALTATSNQVITLQGELTAVSNQVQDVDAALTATSNQVIQLQADIIVTSNQVITLQGELTAVSNQVQDVDAALTVTSNQLVTTSNDLQVLTDDLVALTNGNFLVGGTLRGGLNLISLAVGTSYNVTFDDAQGSLIENNTNAAQLITLLTPVRKHVISVANTIFDVVLTVAVTNVLHTITLNGVVGAPGNKIVSSGDKNDAITVYAQNTTNWVTKGRVGDWSSVAP